MAIDPPVVWFEGMTLDPHHFQQWDRHHRASVDFRLGAVSRFAWGLVELEIDQEGLSNGQFSLRRAGGVTRDGLAFDLPASGALPEARRIQDSFPPTLERLGVFLALPVERLDGSNFLLPGAQSRRVTRFVSTTLNLVDQNTGMDERSIDVARANFQIRFETEAMEDYTALKVAELVRTGSGAFAVDDRFIPPVLSIAASEGLLKITRRLIELLVTKSTELYRRRQNSSGRLEVNIGDVLVMLLQRTVNPAIPVLNHFFSSGRSHPEQLYLKMVELAGQLVQFSTQGEMPPRDFPAYDHGALGRCIGEVDTLIRSLLENALPESNYVTIPLEKRGRGILSGRVADPRMLQELQFFLITSGELTERQAVMEVPQKVRVASPDQIEGVLHAYTRALAVTYVSRPPIGLPIRPGMQYYRLEKVGPFWEAILRTREVSVFLPAEFPNLELQLVAIRS